ncbi:MAG: tyrosine-type recombinase/integrase [Planctomycetia bacterium]|nr:tyrosine-type recombinase/integrase [Planctomycetia bacterium]
MKRYRKAGSWEGAPHYRWTKMIEGTRYRVKCSDLGLKDNTLWTQSDSYPLANKHFQDIKMRLAQVKEDQLPHADSVNATRRELALLHSAGLIDEAMRAQDHINKLKNRPAKPIVSPKLVDDCYEEYRLSRGNSSWDNSLPAVMMSYLKTIELIAHRGRLPEAETVGIKECIRGILQQNLDRAFTDKHGKERLGYSVDMKTLEKLIEVTPRSKSLGYLADQFLKEKKSNCLKLGQSTTDFNNLSRTMQLFKEVFGEETNLEHFPQSKVKQWYDFCKSKEVERLKSKKEGWSGIYAKKVFQFGLALLHWAYNNEHIDHLPRKMKSKEFRFDTSCGDPKVFEPAEISKILLQVKHPIYKACFLLMLNCGMTQADVSDIEKNQVDFQKGTITRRRSKMKKAGKGFTVTHHLWPQTLDCLKEAACNDNLHLLLSETGAKLYEKCMRGDQIVNKDLVYQYWRRTINGSNISLSPRHFRKTGATLITEKFDLSTAQLWLGHTPNEIARKHYVRQTIVPKAVTDYLYGKYFVGSA